MFILFVSNAFLLFLAVIKNFQMYLISWLLKKDFIFKYFNDYLIKFFF